MLAKIKLKEENNYLRQANEQLLREVEKIRKELQLKQQALSAFEDPKFDKFKNMTLAEVIDYVDMPNLEFGDFMYFVNYVLPLVTETEKTFNELKNIRSSSE